MLNGVEDSYTAKTYTQTHIILSSYLLWLNDQLAMVGTDTTPGSTRS